MLIAVRSNSLLRTLTLVLVAGVLSMWALVPPGWMPLPHADGFQITICSGMGPMAPAATMPGMDAQPSHPAGKMPVRDTAHLCPFAGFNAACDSPSLLAVTPALVIAGLFAVVTSLAAPRLGLASPPPAQTGPPSTV